MHFFKTLTNIYSTRAARQPHVLDPRGNKKYWPTCKIHNFVLAQEREVWVEEDKMAEEDFDLQKYFNLHDVDQDGEWNKQVFPRRKVGIDTRYCTDFV